jgi:putative ABC transport system permease protein
MTEQAFQQMFLEMLGNVRAYVRNTALAVVFSLVCVAANAMAMSMRERTREVAVLKAIGFGRALVLRLILSEAVVIAAAGGLVGVLGARLLFGFVDVSRLGLPGITQFYVPWSTVLGGIMLAVFIGLAAGFVPAWLAARTSVVNGLRKVV